MAKKRPPGFMLYEETTKLLSSITDEQAGRIIKAVCSFYVTGEIPSDLGEPIEQAVVDGIIEGVIKDAAAYSQKCERNAENARRRHRDKDVG